MSNCCLIHAEGEPFGRNGWDHKTLRRPRRWKDSRSRHPRSSRIGNLAVVASGRLRFPHDFVALVRKNGDYGYLSKIRRVEVATVALFPTQRLCLRLGTSKTIADTQSPVSVCTASTSFPSDRELFTLLLRRTAPQSDWNTRKTDGLAGGGYSHSLYERYGGMSGCPVSGGYSTVTDLARFLG